MTGSDNEESFSLIGTLGSDDTVRISRACKADRLKADRAATILNWTIRNAKADNLRTVRCLHSGSCGRCGRKLTVPESIDTGLGPECAGRTK